MYVGSLYGAIHPMNILPSTGKTDDIGSETEDVVVVGHCCKSGDLMTPKPGASDDLLVMDGSGAYCAGMSTKNYNSFPETPELMVDLDGKPHMIRNRQPLEEILHYFHSSHSTRLHVSMQLYFIIVLNCRVSIVSKGSLGSSFPKQPLGDPAKVYSHRGSHKFQAPRHIQ